MHPEPAFAWTDRAALRAFVERIAFAHLFVAGPLGVAVIHVPMLPVGEDRLQFHLPHRNRATPLIPGATLIASFAGPDGYISPDWYDLPDQVPTWNYCAVEAEGQTTMLDREGLIAHLDALSAAHEARLAPKPVWTRAKMDPRRFDAMLPAITAYELHVTTWRGTAKLGQNKPARAIASVIAAHPDRALAAAMAAANPTAQAA